MILIDMIDFKLWVAIILDNIHYDKRYNTQYPKYNLSSREEYTILNVGYNY